MTKRPLDVIGKKRSEHLRKYPMNGSPAAKRAWEKKSAEIWDEYRKAREVANG